MIQCLLVGRVGLLQIVHHQIAMAKTAPDVAVCRFNFQDDTKVFDGLREGILGA